MKTPYTQHWIALDALGPEDEDAELRDYVSVDLDEPDGVDELTAMRERALVSGANGGAGACPIFDMLAPAAARKYRP